MHRVFIIVIGFVLFGVFATDEASSSSVKTDSVRLAQIRTAKMPRISKPVMFDTPEADAILSTLEVFPPDNPWNQVVSDWPLHVNSKNIIVSIGADKPLRYNPDMGFVLVPPKQKRVEVRITTYPGESDKGPFPVPDNMPIEGWPVTYQRDHDGPSLTLQDVQYDKLRRGGDRHGIVVDPVNRMLYEFYAARKTDNGWQAAQASVFDLKTNKLRPDGWTSADAAGLPIFPAVVRYDELQRGIVDHAMRVTIRKTRRDYIAPATHFASPHENKDYPRMGERLRLRRDYDVSGSSPEVQAILKGLKRYGMFVADNGIEWAISVAPDPRIPNLHEELRRVKGSDFEVVVAPELTATAQSRTHIKDKEPEQIQQTQKMGEPLPNPLENAEFIQSVSVGNNREIRVNGKPFFPIMSWAQSPKNYRLLHNLGINTHVGRGDPVAAKEAGCYAVPSYKPGVGENGYILAWIFDDEPDMPSGKGADAKPKKSPEYVARKSDSIRKTNPNRPLFMTFTGHFTMEQSTYPEDIRKTLYPQYVSHADVVGFDIYPIYGSGYAAHLDWVGKGVSQLCDLAGPKPIYAWIETGKGSRWMTYEKQPDVLPIHTRNEVWQAITHGVTAIGYFTHAWRPEFKEFAPTQEMQAELKRLNAQISHLAPAILAMPAQENISMKLADGLNCHFKATHYHGDLYIFSVNMDLGEEAKNAKQFDPIDPRGGKAVFTIAGLKAEAKVEVLDETRTIHAEEGKFSDDFAPLAEHIYRINIAHSLSLASIK